MGSITVILIFSMGIPVLLTILNILNLIVKKPLLPTLVDTLIFSLGPFLTFILYVVAVPVIFNYDMHFELTDFYQQPVFNHTIVSLLAVLGLFAYILLRAGKTGLSRPWQLSCIAAIGVGICIHAVWIVQVVYLSFFFEEFLNWLTLFLGLFSFNYILSSVKLLREVLPAMSAQRSHAAAGSE